MVFMRKIYSYFILNAAAVLVCGILTACSDQVVQDNQNQETKTPVALKDFWLTEDSKNDNVLKFATGLEIVLPEEWVGKVVLDSDTGPENDPCVNTLTVCEKTNAEEQCGILFYLELTNYDRDVMSYTFSTVLGLYKQGDTEYVLGFMKPRDLQYVEGDEEKKVAYEQLFSEIDEVRIVTESMDGFTPCTIDDLEWLGEA